MHACKIEINCMNMYVEEDPLWVINLIVPWVNFKKFNENQCCMHYICPIVHDIKIQSVNIHTKYTN